MKRTGQWIFLALFGAAIVLPFCTSFFLCAMPCCHRLASHTSAMQMPMPACPGSSNGCAPTMTAGDEHAAVSAKAPATRIIKLTLAFSTVAQPELASFDNTVDLPLPAASAPLHVLNSVFRI